MAAERLSFIDPGGTERRLDTNGLETLWGVAGRGMPKFEIERVDLPLRAGSYVRNVRAAERSLAVPLRIDGLSRENRKALLRSVASLLNPERGEGRLRSYDIDGTSREVLCRYADGLTLNEDQSEGITGHNAVLVFLASDPYWRDSADTSTPYVLGTAASFFPFPFTITGSTVFATPRVNNAGDSDAYPVWTIEGPGTAIAIRNYTSGKAFTISTTLAAGNKIVVDVSARTIMLGDVNLWPVTAGALWTLKPGQNSIAIEMGDATSASKVTLSYRRRYLTS